jgi:REP element-mobilizing transposase RayT
LNTSPLPQDNITQNKRQPLGIIVGSFKSAVTKRIHDLGLHQKEKIWQRSYFEHVIRDELDYENIFEYIESNPINWSLDEENIKRKIEE